MRVNTDHFDSFCDTALYDDPRRIVLTIPEPPLTRAEQIALTGLGAVDVAKGARKAGGMLLSIAPSTGPAAPFVAAAGLNLLIYGSIFHGADPKQIPAAQAEQIYEAASNNATALVQAGMITPQQAVAGQQNFLSMGVAHIDSLKVGKAGKKGTENITKVIQAQINYTAALPSKLTQPLDLGKARSYYVTGGKWYPKSLTMAADLTDQFLQSLGAGAGPSVSGSAMMAAGEGPFGIPTLAWLLGGAGVLALFMLNERQSQ